jgi:16S rRNA (adenine1518-N6/adenine1519-N6)-dimethyltransferase
MPADAGRASGRFSFANYFRASVARVRAKKHFGQNFLHDRGAIAAVADAAEVGKGDLVLEIGPGTGNLTEELLGRGARVVAVEKDAELLPALRERFAAEIAGGQLDLREGDALEFDAASLPAGAWKLVANIPYYITGAILERYLGGARQPSRASLLVQKEVAERAVARGGRESILSISVKVYGEPRVARKVPAGAFRPAPSVDSAVLAIDRISRERLGGVPDETFFRIVRRGFAHPRKFVRGNLAELLSAEDFDACGVPEKARAEAVSLGAWVCLARRVR